MTLNPRSIVIASNLDELGKGIFAHHFALICCYAGEATFLFNKREYTLRGGDAAVVVVEQLARVLKASPDLNVKVAYISPEMLALSAPTQNNYGINGVIKLFHDPIMQLNDDERQMIQRDFLILEHRVSFTAHHFYWEHLIVALQVLYYDIYHIQHRLYGEVTLSLQNAHIVSQFLTMLQAGEYVRHRTLAYYADKLNISIKHLSDVMRKNTGVSANRWINILTSLEISRQLRDPSVAISDIAYQFHFSSPSYFGRYVQKYLGASPTDIRGRKR